MNPGPEPLLPIAEVNGAFGRKDMMLTRHTDDWQVGKRHETWIYTSAAEPGIRLAIVVGTFPSSMGTVDDFMSGAATGAHISDVRQVDGIADAAAIFRYGNDNRQISAAARDADDDLVCITSNVGIGTCPDAALIDLTKAALTTALEHEGR